MKRETFSPTQAQEVAIAFAKIGKAVNISEVGMMVRAAYEDDSNTTSNNYRLPSSAESLRE